MGLNFTKKLLYLNVLISILKLIYLNFKFTVYVCVCVNVENVDKTGMFMEDRCLSSVFTLFMIGFLDCHCIHQAN